MQARWRVWAELVERPSWEESSLRHVVRVALPVREGERAIGALAVSPSLSE